MSAIEVQILAGSQAGRRLLFDAGPVSIGRAGDCDIVIDLPYVSRRHAELRRDDGGWVFTNLSWNGTIVGRHHLMDREQALRRPVDVHVGEQRVLRLSPLPETRGEAGASASPAPAGESRSPGRRWLSRRTLIWGGIGVYLVAVVGVMVGVSVFRDGGSTQPTDTIGEYPISQLRAEIRESLPQRPPDEARVQEALRQASQRFAMVGSSPDALYRAHEAYQLALQYTAGQTLPDAIDQRRFQIVEQQLIDAVEQEYRNAYHLYQARQYEEAERACRRLAAMYPAGGSSPFFRHVERLWSAASRATRSR